MSRVPIEHTRKSFIFSSQAGGPGLTPPMIAGAPGLDSETWESTDLDAPLFVSAKLASM